jgi:hypothetical protein
VAFGSGNGQFAAVAYYPTGMFSPHALALGDFNHDGRPDVAATIPLAGVAGIFLNQPSGLGMMNAIAVDMTPYGIASISPSSTRAVAPSPCSFRPPSITT